MHLNAFRDNLRANVAAQAVLLDKFFDLLLADAHRFREIFRRVDALLVELDEHLRRQLAALGYKAERVGDGVEARRTAPEGGSRVSRGAQLKLRRFYVVVEFFEPL